MTDKTRPNSRFQDRHLDHLIKRSEQGAPDHVIATELNSLDESHPNRNLVDFSGTDVKAMRTALRLPEPDPTRAMAASTQSAKKPDAVASSSFSAAKMMRESKTAKNKTAPAAKQVFDGVTDDVKARLDSVLTRKRESADFSFKPVIPTSCEQGKVYVYPGVGPVLYQGMEEMTVAGTKMQTLSFKEVFPASTPQTIRFSPAQLSKKDVRELADAQTLDDVLYKLAHGKSTLRGMPKLAGARKQFFDTYLQTSDLARVTDLLCHTLGSGKPAKDLNGLDVQFGNASLRLIAAEYAAVKKMDIADAVTLVKRTIGKPTLDQLSREDYGTGPKDPSPA